ncbi:Chromodomain-helicase-DNA-binding protein 1-like [Apodemus speciosus]|uniref:Chromodomain-helicase-DNA-binding protein 1-like n=1 Tax=Apodemus speciosus TaxID=105296 RepID=A0ABQ0EM94_APOSI
MRIRLRPYQLEGVNWLVQCFHCQNGCILGDEMGLGKTCQTIALLVYLVGQLNDEGPFLILCPLSVLSNWKEEMERFAPGLSCVTYTGDKEERGRLQQDLRQESGFHVLLTTYEACWDHRCTPHLASYLGCRDPTVAIAVSRHHDHGNSIKENISSGLHVQADMMLEEPRGLHLDLKAAETGSHTERSLNICMTSLSQDHTYWKKATPPNSATHYGLAFKHMSLFSWSVLAVDEAHRLKNQSSLLHRTLSELVFRLLLTGTPIHNSLWELYSLLCAVEPELFCREQVEDFVQRYQDIEKESKSASELHRLLQPFLLRRVKAQVATELPKKTEVVMYHGMSALQKKYYKAILMKDLDAFENETAKKVKLQNILTQLRKCVDHPYLFDGVEPEPFEVGEHLIEASGKLQLLDRLLAFLYSGGHRVLLFSQMTHMLDILQDYMDYRGYSYERVDGSVRGEERHLAIKNFGKQPIFVFLLSTRAGATVLGKMQPSVLNGGQSGGYKTAAPDLKVFLRGVGMNLTAADTVIFVDSDFNPQNDLQAAARAHRIGQNKSVKVIRLIGRDTVEEIVYRKAASKLQLTSMVIEGGHFTLGAQKPSAEADFQLSEILKFGLDKLLSSEGSSMEEIDLKSILGETRDGQWTPDTQSAAAEGGGSEEEEGISPRTRLVSTDGLARVLVRCQEATRQLCHEHTDAATPRSNTENHMYVFEGRDYSKEPRKEDRESFEQLVNLQKTLLEKTSHGGRTLRNKGSVLIPGLAEGPVRRKKTLSPEELEGRRRKRQEAAAKRRKLMEEKKKEKEEAEHRKKMAWWEDNGYQSFCLPSEDSELEDLEDGDETSAELDSEDLDSTSINYVSGDVTHPQAGEEDAVIVHCVDDSGRWGRGGLFTALEARSAEPRKIYELAGKMEDGWHRSAKCRTTLATVYSSGLVIRREGNTRARDLSLGDVLLFPIDDKESRDKGQDLLALVVAQHRDRTNVLSGIKMAALEEGLKKIFLAAKKKKASVHLPRIGHATKGFNWYGTERLIRKHLATRGIPTYMYPFVG